MRCITQLRSRTPNRDEMGNRNAANRVGAGRMEEFLPAHHSLPNWPKGLRIDKLNILLEHNIAVAEINGARLGPPIPLDQLARFLNEHVQGAVGQLTVTGGEGGLEDMVPRLIDEMTVPGRLNVDCANFFDFFHLPWADIVRIFDGWILRAQTINFFGLQLPSGVDANELLKSPAVRECSTLLVSNDLPQLPGPPPLFDNAALMEWLEQSDDRALILPTDYFSDGHLSFLNALKENFQQATQVHWYGVRIDCPNITGGLGVQDGELFNRVGEKMVIKVGPNPTPTEKMEHPFEVLRVWRR